MSASEREVNPQGKEATNWSPSVKVVPHHLFQANEIGHAFQGFIDPKFSALLKTWALQSLKKTMGDSDGYFKDLLGTTQEENDKFKDNIALFLQQIKDLSSNSVVQVDLLDDLCKGCAIGAHCTATNVLMLGHTGQYELTTPLESELEYIQIVQRRLEDKDFSKGTDFKTLITHHTLVDFEGNILNEPPKNPKLIPIEFPSLLVRTPAMRALFGRVDK